MALVGVYLFMDYITSPTGHELVVANDKNIRFNAGIEAAHHIAAKSCPIFAKNYTDFCAGWRFAHGIYNETEYDRKS